MTKEIKVVSFNIHKGLSPFRRKKTLNEVKYLLEKAKPDIVCLQEIGSRFLPIEEVERFETQLEYLATSFWPHHCYQKNASYPAGHHGNAILSRWPIVQTESVDLTLNALEKRGLLHARIQHPMGHTLHTLCTHLNLFESDRFQQIDRIKSYVSEELPSEEPTVFSGDFNDWTRRIFLEELFDEAFRQTKGQFAKSFPSFYPLLTLDRIYYRNLSVQTAEVLSNPRFKFISDHLPLQALLKLPEHGDEHASAG